MPHLYYVQRRYYDPTTRAFLARDPLRADGDESPYQYCGGNPVELVDPEGLEAKKAGAGAAWYAPNNRNTSTTTSSSSSSSSGGTGGGAGVGASDTVAPPNIPAPSAQPLWASDLNAASIAFLWNHAADIPDWLHEGQDFLFYSPNTWVWSEHRRMHREAPLGARLQDEASNLMVMIGAGAIGAELDGILGAGLPRSRLPGAAVSDAAAERAAGDSLLARVVRNPWGRRGSPAHQARIGEVEARLGDAGWDTFSGGSMPERMAPGCRRYPDLVMIDGNSTVAIQVGRTTRSGLPVARERTALADLRATGQYDHVFFLSYTP